MRLAFEYCKGEGIEFGAAAHNPFELPYCRNVAPCDGVNTVYEQDRRDFTKYSKEQGDMCQQIAPVQAFQNISRRIKDDVYGMSFLATVL